METMRYKLKPVSFDDTTAGYPSQEYEGTGPRDAIILRGNVKEMWRHRDSIDEAANAMGKVFIVLPEDIEVLEVEEIDPVPRLEGDELKTVCDFVAGLAQHHPHLVPQEVRDAVGLRVEL